MTKSELIEQLAKKQPHLALQDVELAVKCMLEQMSQSLSTNERIEVRGFGSFRCIIASLEWDATLKQGMQFP